MAKSKNKWMLPVGIIVGILVLFGLWYVSTYNSLIGQDENVKQKWGNVQTAYQRRADLIPNLVSTVQASAEFEQDTLAKVTMYRAGIANAETPEDLDILGREINTAINLAFEAYPDIKTTAAFADLQTQLEGTENRIKVERDNYNAAIKSYNIKVRGFPTNFVAKRMGLEVKNSFAAAEGAENAPNVGDLFDN